MVRLVFLSTIYLVLLDASCAFLCATTAQATPRLIGVANATGEQEDEAGKGSAELQQIRDDWVNEIIKAGQARRNAKSPLELEQVQKVLSTKEQSFIERCMALAMKQPDSWAGLAALKLVACRSPETNEGQQAADRLVKQAATANLDIVAMALDFPAVSASSSERTLRTAVSIILERVKKQPDHSEAARLLASIVCRFAVEGEKGMQAPPEFANAADLIIERYADSPDILNFCELLWSSNDSPPPWAGSFEKHLRTILKRNKHRDVRV